MKLSKYLADYIEYEVTEGENRHTPWDNLDFEVILEQGIEAFESTEGVKIFIVSEEIADEIGQLIMEAEE